METYHAALRDESSAVVWQCEHYHRSQEFAMGCASEEDARRAAAE